MECILPSGFLTCPGSFRVCSSSVCEPRLTFREAYNDSPILGSHLADILSEIKIRESAIDRNIARVIRGKSSRSFHGQSIFPWYW